MKFHDLTIHHVCISKHAKWFHCTEHCVLGVGSVAQLVLQIIIWVKLLQRGHMKSIYSMLYLTLLGMAGVQIEHNMIISSVPNSKLMYLLLNSFLFVLVYKFWRLNVDMKNLLHIGKVKITILFCFWIAVGISFVTCD